MNDVKVKLEYEVLENKNTGVSVIVVAGGSSSRMQGVNKQLLELCGVPVIIRTLQKFENCAAVSNIILVTRSEDLFQIQMLSQKYMLTKLTDIVCGGASRQESVLKGFDRVKEDCQKVLIHDGARPFVSEKIITEVATALDDFSAVTCGVKLKDTVKQVDSENNVLKTLNRDTLVAVQTPQGVRRDDYLKAVEKEDISKFTDDTSIMEAAGHKVFVVDGSYENIKITTKEDLVFAKAILREQEND